MTGIAPLMITLYQNENHFFSFLFFLKESSMGLNFCFAFFFFFLKAANSDYKNRTIDCNKGEGGNINH